MGHAVFAVALSRWQLVVAGEAQLVVLQVEDGVSAPLVGIVRTTARAQSAAPLIREHDLLPIVRKRSRVPIRIVRIIYRVHALWIRRIFDVQKNSIARAGAGRQSDR